VSIAIVAGRRDFLVLAIGEPRETGDVPGVGEPALGAAPTQEIFVDRACAPKNPALVIDGVQLADKVLALQVGKPLVDFAVKKLNRVDCA